MDASSSHHDPPSDLASLETTTTTTVSNMQMLLFVDDDDIISGATTTTTTDENSSSHDDSSNSYCPANVWTALVKERIAVQRIAEPFSDRIAVEPKTIVSPNNLDNNNNNNNAAAVVFAFHVHAEMGSTTTATTLRSWVLQAIHEAWDTDAERESFLASLRAACAGTSDSSIWRHAMDVRVVAATAVPTSSEQIGEEDEASSEGMMVRVAVALVVSLLVCGCCCCCGGFIWYYLQHQKTPGEANGSGKPNGDAEEGAFLEIACATSSTTNDISTLGDPIPAGTPPNDLMGMSTFGSTSLDYDYQLAFGKVSSAAKPQAADELTRSSVLSSLQQQQPSCQEISMADVPQSRHIHSSQDSRTESEDENFSGKDESCLCVYVPPGPLGLVLQSHPSNGRPMVLHVKHSSPLAGFGVQPGDCFLAVQHQPVAHLNPQEVSTLIVEEMKAVLESASSGSDASNNMISLVFSKTR